MTLRRRFICMECNEPFTVESTGSEMIVCPLCGGDRLQRTLAVAPSGSQEQRDTEADRWDPSQNFGYKKRYPR